MALHVLLGWLLGSQQSEDTQGEGEARSGISDVCFVSGSAAASDQPPRRRRDVSDSRVCEATGFLMHVDWIDLVSLTRRSGRQTQIDNEGKMRASRLPRRSIASMD